MDVGDKTESALTADIQRCTSASDNHISTSNSLEPGNKVTFEMLQHAVNKSVARITSKPRMVVYFKEHFRKVYEADQKSVLGIYKSMMSQLESMIKDEIQMQLNACNVEELLCSLDKIKLENISPERAWRPSGSPEEDMKAHNQEMLQKELHQLEKVLTTLESQNKYLNECVAKHDEKLLQSLKMAEDYCSSWEEAALVMSDETKEKLIQLNMSLSKAV